MEKNRSIFTLHQSRCCIENTFSSVSVSQSLFPQDTNSGSWILSGICSAAAQLPSSHSHPPIPLSLPNPLSSPAADKEQCVAAFTLRSSGRWKISCSCTLLAYIISRELSSIQRTLTISMCVCVCVSKCVFYQPLLCQVICLDSAPLAGHNGLPEPLLCPYTHTCSHTQCQCWIILTTDSAIGRQRGYGIAKVIIRELANSSPVLMSSLSSFQVCT